MTYPPDSSKPDPNYLPIQLELDIQPEPEPETQLEVQSRQRHRREWHQNAAVRTWLFPPIIGAGLGVLYAIWWYYPLIMYTLLDEHHLDLSDFRHLPNNLWVCTQLGAYMGVPVSVLIHLVKYPRGNLAQVLKAIWKVVAFTTLLFATLMSFGLLGGLLGSQFNRRL